MINNPIKVEPRKVASVDINSFAVGLFTGGASIAPNTSFTDSTNVELDLWGYIIPRRKLVKFLPDTVQTTYQKYPTLWNGVIYYFTMDNGQVMYCQETDTAWSVCSGSNSFTTNNGGMPKFLRVLDNVLVLNGKNGDYLAYVDLAGTGFPIVKYTAIADPTTAFPSPTYTNLSSTGSFYVYYAYSYTGSVGETNLSPIIAVPINYTRDRWSGLSTPGYLTLTRPGTAPSGSKYWNVYVAVTAASGTISASDMLLVAPQLDLASNTFVDTGVLSLILSSLAPIDNSTIGPRVEQGILFEGSPILFGDQDNPYAIWIGGGGVYAMDFSISNGGYKDEPEKGSNFYPNSVVGFRTGTGVASLVVFFSNTEGISHQALLAQQTVTYGSQTFNVWATTDQHYGAAGVASPNSAVNYNGQLCFLSTDGIVSVDTAASRYNVLSLLTISHPVDSFIKSIKVSAMTSVVGTAWDYKFMWLIPGYGFDTPQQILIYDTSNAGMVGKGAWYIIDIPANWIGVSTPSNEGAFVYISQGKSTYKLTDIGATYDIVEGVQAPFATSVTGPIISSGGETHNTWVALVQAVFYLIDLVGSITIGVNYWDQSGIMKTKTTTYQGPVVNYSVQLGWGDTQWTYSHFSEVTGWGASVVVTDITSVVNAVSTRVKLGIDDIANEMQWFYYTNNGNNNYRLKSVSFEGIELGIRPDLQ